MLLRNGLIEVSELADHLDQKIPDISFEAFKLRQVPQRSIVGSNFVLAAKTEILAAAAPAIPTRPTHVAIAAADVLATASNDGAVVEKLPAGAQVTLVES